MNVITFYGRGAARLFRIVDDAVTGRKLLKLSSDISTITVLKILSRVTIHVFNITFSVLTLCSHSSKLQMPVRLRKCLLLEEDS
ncbi:hypothetical protein CHS0354_013958 [Potamilus streckersoni]|uniref:Uncharacterized protein n=1 Tax=Potamilus streckersoni TaxID=2493646 RepID=A0AAE0RXD3_9BIVA|nr:hypothetical protein CHS0354_013958 [Potamilus streckersoni]